jgi:adenine-specific DNA-methyltransferase
VAPPKKAAGPKPVVATTHDEKRPNIPTADAQDLVTDEIEAAVKVRWPRDHSLDPQLVWKGKDTEADVLEGDAPPIYIQEKIDPRVLVENLRRTAAGRRTRARADAVRHLRRAERSRRREFYRTTPTGRTA